jgi:hypothetical protein
MNFGFLGSESQWRLIQPAFGPMATVRLVAAVIKPADNVETPPEILTRFPLPPTARRLQEFDELLSDQHIEAFILGGPVADRPDRLRQIAQTGRHCVCLYPLDASPLVYHELAMLASDRAAILVPWLPSRVHTGCRTLAEVVHGGSLGTVRSITIERFGPLVTGQLLVCGVYAEAVDLLSMLRTGVFEVSSTGDPDKGRLVVHHRLADDVTGEIRIQPSNTAADEWKVVVEGESDRAELVLHDGFAGPASIVRSERAGHREEIAASEGVADQILEEMTRATLFLPHTLTWGVAIAAAELADCARYSLERRRAVDVFQEERGELASFKGRMTSIGCGLIWLTLFIVILIAAGTGLQLPGMKVVAVATAAVWVLFLLFQALRWTVPAQKGPDQSSGSTSASALR